VLSKVSARTKGRLVPSRLCVIPTHFPYNIRTSYAMRPTLILLFSTSFISSPVSYTYTSIATASIIINLQLTSTSKSASDGVLFLRLITSSMGHEQKTVAVFPFYCLVACLINITSSPAFYPLFVNMYFFVVIFFFSNVYSLTSFYVDTLFSYFLLVIAFLLHFFLFS